MKRREDILIKKHMVEKVLNSLGYDFTDITYKEYFDTINPDFEYTDKFIASLNRAEKAYKHHQLLHRDYIYKTCNLYTSYRAHHKGERKRYKIYLAKDVPVKSYHVNRVKYADIDVGIGVWYSKDFDINKNMCQIIKNEGFNTIAKFFIHHNTAYRNGSLVCWNFATYWEYTNIS